MHRGLRFLFRTAGGLWSVLMVFLMLASLMLSVAMTLLPGVLSAVASVVEGVTGRKSVVTEARAREAKLTDDVNRAHADLNAERTGRRREVQLLRQQITSLADDDMVTYRGQRVAVKDAVRDTSERVSRRVKVAAGRNIASTAGEALPIVGVGVIVAATAWELNDACQLVKEMRELDSAFNPDNLIGEDEICGIKPPTREEVWHAIKSSPGAAWDSAKGLYADLPEADLSSSYNHVAGWMTPTRSLLEADDEELAVDHPASADLHAVNRGESWNPLSWWSKE